MARVRKRDKLDGIDAERIQQTIESVGWQFIRQRVERALRLKLDELVAPHSEVDTATIRGFIAGLKTALDIPAILLKEAKENRSDGTDEPGRD